MSQLAVVLRASVPECASPLALSCRSAASFWPSQQRRGLPFSIPHAIAISPDSTPGAVDHDSTSPFTHGGNPFCRYKLFRPYRTPRLNRRSASACRHSSRCAHIPVPFHGQFKLQAWERGAEENMILLKFQSSSSIRRTSSWSLAPCNPGAIMTGNAAKNNRARAGLQPEAIH
jgi:hypothetical protein